MKNNTYHQQKRSNYHNNRKSSSGTDKRTTAPYTYKHNQRMPEPYINRYGNMTGRDNVHQDHKKNTPQTRDNENKKRMSYPEREDKLCQLLSEIRDIAYATNSRAKESFSGTTSDRVAIFVDGSNIRYALKALNYELDVKAFLNYIEREIGHVADAYYYDSEDRAENTDLDFTPEHGFARILKPVKEINLGKGQHTKKCNLDVEIVLDMMATVAHYDICVLLSGDSDFKRPLEVLRSMGKKFVVVSTIGSLSKELKDLAGRHLVLLEEHQSEFTKSDIK